MNENQNHEHISYFVIRVKSLDGVILSFNVKKYNIDDGFVVFSDRNEKVQRFAVSNCEIKEVIG